MPFCEAFSFDYILVELRPSNYDQVVSYLDAAGLALLGNFSDYNAVDNPNWDGTHNDYLFSAQPKRAFISAPTTVRAAS